MERRNATAGRPVIMLVFAPVTRRLGAPPYNTNKKETRA
jgi:hypothetical protein